MTQGVDIDMKVAVIDQDILINPIINLYSQYGIHILFRRPTPRPRSGDYTDRRSS